MDCFGSAVSIVIDKLGVSRLDDLRHNPDMQRSVEASAGLRPLEKHRLLEAMASPGGPPLEAGVAHRDPSALLTTLAHSLDIVRAQGYGQEEEEQVRVV